MLLFFFLLVVGVTSLKIQDTNTTSRASAAVLVSPTVSPMPAVIINHNNVDASVIPTIYLGMAQQKSVVFDHHSIGGNIMTGMTALQSQSPNRYPVVSQFGPSSTWFTTHHGTGINIGEFQDGDNYYPETKIAGFDSTMRSGIGNVANYAGMKFCFLDIYDDAANGLSTWNSYRTMMLNLMATYPNTKFYWVTDALEQALSSAYINHEKSIFNNAVRQYVQANGGVLFDLADIESHDPNGNLITDSHGYEALYSGYAQTQDHHLNGTGQVRVAQGMWWMFARMSGWDGGSSPSPTPSSIPTPTPTIDIRRADIDHSGTVTVQDFNLLRQQFGTACTPGMTSCADIDCSGIVNTADQNVMREQLGRPVQTQAPTCPYLIITPTLRP